MVLSHIFIIFTVVLSVVSNILNLQEMKKQISLELRGTGNVQVCLDTPEGEVVAAAMMDYLEWDECNVPMKPVQGVHALYVRVKTGVVDFAAFKIS